MNLEKIFNFTSNIPIDKLEILFISLLYFNFFRNLRKYGPLWRNVEERRTAPLTLLLFCSSWVAASAAANCLLNTVPCCCVIYLDFFLFLQPAFTGGYGLLKYHCCHPSTLSYYNHITLFIREQKQ